jgi:hypothetical protein
LLIEDKKHVPTIANWLKLFISENGSSIFDQLVLSTFFSNNKSDINNLIYWTSSENGNQSSNMNQMKALKNKGVNLINLIKSEIE